MEDEELKVMEFALNSTEAPCGHTRCKADDIRNPLTVEDRIKQSVKDSGRVACPKCGGWMLQPINEEVDFCVECGTYSTKQGSIVSEESLIASGDIIVREKTVGKCR